MTLANQFELFQTLARHVCSFILFLFPFFVKRCLKRKNRSYTTRVKEVTVSFSLAFGNFLFSEYFVLWFPLKICSCISVFLPPSVSISTSCDLSSIGLQEMRQGGSYLLVATDLASRGVDLPETTHIYNFDLPKNAVDYLHRAGRTGRRPFSDDKCIVTSIITPEERFALQRFENELVFNCAEMFL